MQKEGSPASKTSANRFPDFYKKHHRIQHRGFESRQILAHRERHRLKDTLCHGESIASNGEYSIEDKVRISYDGKTEHDIKITGDSEDLARRVTESVQDMKFKPETIGAPGLDKTVAVNTYDTYEFDYAISMEAENLILVKNADGIKVRKGNMDFYNSNKNWINGHLSENGVYNLDAWKKK